MLKTHSLPRYPLCLRLTLFRIAHLEKDKEELVSTHQVEIEQQITCSANAANLAAQEHSYSVTKAQVSPRGLGRSSGESQGSGEVLR